MRIAAINVLPNGSPATIMRGILEVAEKEINAETVSFYGNWRNCPKEYRGSIRFGYRFENYCSAIIAQRTGIHGKGSFLGTLSLIKKLKKFKPDIIHIHNLHLWCINVPMLFDYIKKNNIKVIWTLHDCWAFTGRCPYFQISRCDKWKTGCHDCPYPAKDYPASYCDRTHKMWNYKKEWFSGVPNMMLVTPSEWLADLVRESFLSEYTVRVINNGIDLNVFKPTESDFRSRHGIGGGKTLILGVALSWSFYKGLDVFVELSKILDDRYQIILVGVDEHIAEQIPDNVLLVPKTNSAKELSEIYTAADIFVNPTREEVFGMTNIEALACGTPVVTFNTGGCPEIIDETCGVVIADNKIEHLTDVLVKFENYKEYTKKCLKRSKYYSLKEKFKEYIKLYEELQE